LQEGALEVSKKKKKRGSSEKLFKEGIVDETEGFFAYRRDHGVRSRKFLQTGPRPGSRGRRLQRMVEGIKASSGDEQG